MLKTMILQILLTCHSVGRVMPKHLLKAECEMQAGGQIGDSEFETAVADLLKAGYINFVVDDLTKDRKYHITDLGRTHA